MAENSVISPALDATRRPGLINPDDLHSSFLNPAPLDFSDESEEDPERGGSEESEHNTEEEQGLDTNMPDHADVDVSTVDNLERARELVTQARQQRDNKTVHLKVPPPDLNVETSYTIWKRKLKTWQKMTCLNDVQQACTIMTDLRDDCKLKPGISTLLFRTLTEAEVENPTTKRVLEFLDEQLNLDQYGEIWDLFRNFITVEIKPDEKFQDFTARFQSAYQALVKKDPDCSMSEKVLAMFLRHAARLDTSMLMNVRTNVKWKDAAGNANKEVFKDTIKVINEIMAGEKFASKGSQQVRLTAATGEVHMVQYIGDKLYDNEDQMISMKQHAVLMAEVKPIKPRRPRKKKVGFKNPLEENSTGAKPKELAKIKCYNCQQMGHYKTNCPLLDDENHLIQESYCVEDIEEEQLAEQDGTEDSDGEEEIDYEALFASGPELDTNQLTLPQLGVNQINLPQLVDMEAEDSEDEEETSPVPSAQNYDNSVLPGAGGHKAQVSRFDDFLTPTNPIHSEDDIVNIDDGEDQDECFAGYVDNKKWETKTFTAEAEGAAGLDSCCSRTIMGTRWFARYKQLLATMDRELLKEIKGPFKTETNFLFGDGGKKNSLGRYILPLTIHGCRANIAAELVDSDIPLLISKASMIRAGMVLDFKKLTVTAFGRERMMRETVIGHPVVSIMPVENPEPFLDEVLITEGGQRQLREVSEERQRKIIRKAHQQAGHPSKEKLVHFLRNSSYKWDPKVVKDEVEKLHTNCEKCILKKRTPCKPAAAIPSANSFNDTVGLDLKVYGDGGPIILYVIDIWSKFMQARIVKSKKAEDILVALFECWISVFGAFKATLHDNGGEFISRAFSQMADLLMIEDRTGAAHSPWSYGLVEKHHAVVDKTFEALKRDYPHYRDSTLLQWAITVKNSTTTAAGWSPFQVVFGKNPVLPSLLEANPASMKDEVLSKSLEENFNAMNAARISYNQAIADHQLQRMLKAKLRRNQTVFQQGDQVYWKDNSSNKEEWRQGKVLAEDGKLLFIKTGSNLYRVHTDMTIKRNEEYDKNGKLVTPVEVLRTEEARRAEREERRPRRRELQISLDETDQLEDQEAGPDIELQGDVFEDREDDEDNAESEAESAEQSEAAAGVETQSGDQVGDSGAPSVQIYDDQDGQVSHRAGGEISQVSRNNILLSPANSNHSEETVEPEQNTRPNETEDGDTATLSAQTYDDQDGQVSPGADRETAQVSRTNTDLNPANSRNFEDPIASRPSREARAVMVRQEVQEGLRRSQRQTKRKADTTEEVSPKPRVKRRNQTAPARPVKPKSTGEKINLADNSIIYHGGKACQVMGRAATARGGYYNYYNLQPMDGSKPYSVDLQRSEYSMDVDGEQQAFITMEVNQNGEQHEVFMETIPYHLHGNQECVQAKMEELDKIVNQFKAVKVVRDVGQFKISTRFVLWYKKHSSGEVQVRARLVARGYEEQDWVPSDSPTMDQINLKLIVLIAQAEKMNVVSADVKGAFLQGLPLTERTVTVIPPPEAKVPKGYTWQLVVALYGLDDASLRFHWKVRQVMAKLGMQQSRLDPALFFMKDKKGRLLGMIGTHVDDFIIAGKDGWINAITEKIKKEFLLGTMEKEDFLYCGHRIKQQAGRLTLDQEEFAKTIKPLVISPERKRQGAEEVTEKERTVIRGYAGKLGWLARTTRPDLIIPQIRASSAVTRATVNDLKDLAKAVSKVGGTANILNIPVLAKDMEGWRMQVYTDAAWQNLEEIGSTGGKVVIITDGKKHFPITWSANRIRRVCHSSMQAELMAANEGLKDGQYVKELIKEMTGNTLGMELITDNKNAHALIQATTAPQDKRVKCEAAALREAYLTKEVEDIKLVSGKTGQLADCLTKLQADSSSLLAMVQTSKEIGLGRD